MIGASVYSSYLALSLDVPTAFGPPLNTTVLPGELLGWTGSGLVLLSSLQGWPISSELGGAASPGNPGLIGADLRVSKSMVTPGDLALTWGGSCSAGGEDVAIYEGTIGSWYSHTRKGCTDAGKDRREEITPASGSRYYLVVPRNAHAEGSYGTSSGGTQIPRAPDSCAASQVITPCPR